MGAIASRRVSASSLPARVLRPMPCTIRTVVRVRLLCLISISSPTYSFVVTWTSFRTHTTAEKSSAYPKYLPLRQRTLQYFGSPVTFEHGARETNWTHNSRVTICSLPFQNVSYIGSTCQCRTAHHAAIAQYVAFANGDRYQLRDEQRWLISSPCRWNARPRSPRWNLCYGFRRALCIRL